MLENKDYQCFFPCSQQHGVDEDLPRFVPLSVRTLLLWIILYGSVARGDAVHSSDIDLLILLSPPFDYFAELRKIVDLLYPIQLESEQLISPKPALASDYEMGSISLYRNAKREGVAV